jgi:hypothetical protein
VHSHSATPSLLRALTREAELGQRADVLAAAVGQDIESAELADEAWELTAVEIATSQMKGPLQRVEFVAKRLLWGEAKGFWGGAGSRVMLGSPIYVALND